MAIATAKLSVSFDAEFLFTLRSYRVQFDVCSSIIRNHPWYFRLNLMTFMFSINLYLFKY
jgi:hypothetical protein